MAATKTEADMAARLETLDPGSLRYVVLESAIDFKRSWVALARHLTEARQAGVFKEWGYRTFEAYAQNELHLRRETAQKLVRSFDFLNAHEKPRLEALEGGDPGTQEPTAPLPSYQALDVLAAARQNPYLAEDDYREIRDQVFREDPPANVVRRLVKDRAPEPAKEAPDQNAQFRKALTMAERLYGLLRESEAPEGVCRAAEQVVGGLRRLIEE